MNMKNKNRLLFMMHRAWVESRLLVQVGSGAQAEYLADIMELVPGIVAFERDDANRLVRALDEALSISDNSK